MTDNQDLENEEFCYICFEGATRAPDGTVEPLVQVCRCPTRVHRRCVARWQLYSAGKREEKSCRFCQGTLPDWKEVLTPRALPPAIPVLSIYYNNTCCRMKVRPGPDGLQAFLRQLEMIVGRDVANVNFVFRCRCPDTGAEIFLQGLQAFEAAMHCACVRAAQRSMQQQHQQLLLLQQQQQRQPQQQHRQQQDPLNSQSQGQQQAAHRPAQPGQQPQQHFHRPLAQGLESPMDPADQDHLQNHLLMEAQYSTAGMQAYRQVQGSPQDLQPRRASAPAERIFTPGSGRVTVHPASPLPPQQQPLPAEQILRCPGQQPQHLAQIQVEHSAAEGPDAGATGYGLRAAEARAFPGCGSSPAAARAVSGQIRPAHTARVLPLTSSVLPLATSAHHPHQFASGIVAGAAPLLRGSTAVLAAATTAAVTATAVVPIAVHDATATATAAAVTAPVLVPALDGIPARRRGAVTSYSGVGQGAGIGPDGRFERRPGTISASALHPMNLMEQATTPSAHSTGRSCAVHPANTSTASHRALTTHTAPSQRQISGCASGPAAMGPMPSAGSGGSSSSRAEALGIASVSVVPLSGPAVGVSSVFGSSSVATLPAATVSPAVRATREQHASGGIIAAISTGSGSGRSVSSAVPVASGFDGAGMEAMVDTARRAMGQGGPGVAERHGGLGAGAGAGAGKVGSGSRLRSALMSVKGLRSLFAKRFGRSASP